MEEPVPLAGACASFGEVRGQDLHGAEGVVGVAFVDGAAFGDDGDGVEEVAQDVAGFIQSGLRAGGAAAADEVPAVGGVEDIFPDGG